VGFREVEKAHPTAHGCKSKRGFGFVIRVDVWLQSRFLTARGRVGLEIRRYLCIIDAGNVFISTAMG
jgi:hypothetical protein